jgi:hypothetical protein
MQKHGRKTTCGFLLPSGGTTMGVLTDRLALIRLSQRKPGFGIQGKGWEKTKRKRMITKMNIDVKKYCPLGFLVSPTHFPLLWSWIF